MHGGNEKFLIFLKGWKCCTFLILGEQIWKPNWFYTEPLMPDRQGTTAFALFICSSPIRAGCRRTLILSSDTEEPHTPTQPTPPAPLPATCHIFCQDANCRGAAQHSTAWVLAHDRLFLNGLMSPQVTFMREEKTQQEKTDK